MWNRISIINSGVLVCLFSLLNHKLTAMISSIVKLSRTFLICILLRNEDSVEDEFERLFTFIVNLIRPLLRCIADYRFPKNLG